MNDNKTLNVKLIHCGNVNIANPEDNMQKNTFYMPMGLFAMADRLKKNGINIEILHIDLESELEITKILDFKTLDAVGFDCHWVNQALCVIETAELIKKTGPQVFTFLGGFSASLFAEEIIAKYPFIDAVVRGDGEVPVVELCRYLQNGQPSPENVQNLVWRDETGDVRVNEISYVAAPADLEQLDFAQIDLLRNWQSYIDLSTFWTKFSPLDNIPIFFLEIGRGCIYNCTFCGGNSKAQYRMNNRKGQVVRSVDSALDTIKKAASFGYKLIYSCFEFEGSDDWYLQLFEKIREEKLRVSYGYGCYQVLSKPMIDALSESFENVIIELSPETASHELRRKNKDPRIFYTNRELEECLDYIGTKPNLKVQLYFGYFLPYDTGETVFETIRFITRLYLKYAHFTELIYGNFSTDPGSLLYFEPDAYDIDIKTRCFSDYIDGLRESYLTKKDTSAPDMTLFKPNDMSYDTFIALSGKVRLFNYLLLLFGDSVNLLIKKIGNTDVIAEYLQKLKPTAVTTRDLAPANLKKILLNICKEHIFINGEIIKTLSADLQKANQTGYKVTANI
ncbi:MAG: hypothetical protein GY757_35430 [bacterium]|nr:hypothetical protein [bacterium]